MKTYTPKGLSGSDLREILEDLHATPAAVAKYLRVTERSVWRWLADGSAPFAAVATLWHATPAGRETSALDVGNELVIQRGLTRCAQDAQAVAGARLVALLAISDTGAANDPFCIGPGGGGGNRPQKRPQGVTPAANGSAPADYLRLRN